MECSQPTAWTTKRSLLVAYRLKALSGRPSLSQNGAPGKRYDRVSSVSFPSTRHVLRYHPTCDLLLLALSRMLTIHHLHPCSHQPTIAMTNDTQTPNVINTPHSTRSSSASECHPQASVVMVMRKAVVLVEECYMVILHC